MYKIISTGMAVRTVLPTVEPSIALRQEDLIDELNAFYVELTGDGLSEEYRAELREQDLDSLMRLIERRRRFLTADFMPED